MAARNRATGLESVASSRLDDGLGPLLVPLGVLSAVVLPYFVFSLASDDSLREVKLFSQVVGGACVLLGFAVRGREAPAPGASRIASPARWLLALALAWTFGSLLVNGGHVDPLVAVSMLGPLVLLSAGASRNGAFVAERVFAALSLAGVVTAFLAFGQRFAGFPRLPLQFPEPRFLATALLGNPGDVAAALTLPGVLLWARVLSGDARPRTRVLSFVGLVIVLLGLGATESVMPILAVLAGMLLYVLFDLRRRLVPFAAGAALVALTAFGTGAGSRMLTKVQQLRSGQYNRFVTQRDIGIESAREMIGQRPWFGVGPGCYSSAFVPARLLAESRLHRRMVHFSDSSHFENAHSEPFNVAAECGLPTAAFGILSLGALLAGLVAIHRRAGRGDSNSPDSGLLFALLASLAILSVASFPLRLPVTAGPGAYIAGLAWTALRSPGTPASETRERKRRIGFGLLAASLVVLAFVRLAATLLQAEGEERLRQLGDSAPEIRLALLPSAKSCLQQSLLLRPRRPSAWLALGSALRLDQSFDEAWESLLRSLALEERGETDLNLALLALERKDISSSNALFRRAVWVFPRLIEAAPDAALPANVELDIAEAESRLTLGGPVPPLPPVAAARTFFP